MSLILDALRKSDRQRARNAAQRLHDGPASAQAPKISRWLLAGMLVGLLLLAALVLLVLVNPPGVPKLSSDAGSVAGGTSEIMENDPSRATVRSLRGELAGPAPRRAESLATVEETAGSSPAEQEPPGRQASIDDLNAVPFDTLPVAMRAQLPRLHVDIHAWSEDPETRFVLINLRRYQEGDRLNEGPLVRRILPDGVVLDSNGTLFSLPRQ